MANPQLENGYIKIANELFEAIARIRIPGEVRQVIDVILRKTYGFNKKTDCIALSQFELSTGIDKSHCSRALNKALSMNLITKKGGGKATTYSLNKNYDSWKPLPKRATVAKQGNKSLPKKAHTKDNVQKTYANQKNTDPRIKILLDFWHELIVEKKEFKPSISAKDAGLIKQRLSKGHTVDELKLCMEYYLTADKAQKHGVSLRAAISDHTINLYLEKQKKEAWKSE